MNVLIAYIPVIHQGYITLLNKHAHFDRLYIFGTELIRESDYLHKEIRALKPSIAALAIESLEIFTQVELATPQNLANLDADNVVVVMPDEDVCREVARKYLPNCTVAFDPIFLRWDKSNTQAAREIEANAKITHDDFSREIMVRVEQEKNKSSDWWRQIGAAIVKDGNILLIDHNRHVPSPHTPYTNGDPRNAFKKGVLMEFSSAHHAERRLIAHAAREGIALKGTWLYSSTFPCPPCAKDIVLAGIEKCFFSEGYGILDSEDVLRASGVEIIRVEQKIPSHSS